MHSVVTCGHHDTHIHTGTLALKYGYCSNASFDVTYSKLDYDVMYTDSYRNFFDKRLNVGLRHN